MLQVPHHEPISYVFTRAAEKGNQQGNCCRRFIADRSIANIFSMHILGRVSPTTVGWMKGECHISQQIDRIFSCQTEQVADENANKAGLHDHTLRHHRYRMTETKMQPSCGKMGRTNIHQALALFIPSGTVLDEIAHIPYADKLLYIVATPMDQTDVNRYAGFIRKANMRSWIRKEAGSSEPDGTITIPKVMVSFGMQSPGAENTVEEEHVGPKPDELAYVLIIQGRSGDVLGKPVIEPTVHCAAARVMHEVLNGYSTVFMAAILATNAGKLSDCSYSFKAVEYSRELKTIDEDPGLRCIGFWC